MGLDAQPLDQGRAGPGIPEGGHGGHQGRVFRRFGDGLVELPIRALALHHVGLVLPFHLPDQGLEPFQAVGCHPQGGAGTDLALDDAPRLQQLERADIGNARGLGRGGAPDIDAGAEADLHQAFQLQGHDGFPDRGSGHGEGLGQLPLRRQATAQLVGAGPDAVCQHVGHVFIEPAAAGGRGGGAGRAGGRRGRRQGDHGPNL